MSAQKARRPRGMGVHEKMAKGEMNKSLVKIGQSMRRYWPAIFVSFFFIIGYVVIAVIAPNILKDLTNTIVSGAESRTIDIDKISGFGTTLAILYVVSALSNFTSSFIMTTVAQRYTHSL